MGASAGGLEAFQRFFRAMPVDSGMALVLIVHLDPHQKSVMAEVLGRITGMPVHPVTVPMPLEANNVYVIAPGTLLRLHDGQLVPEPMEPAQRTPIDVFFLSLAQAYGDRAVCVVLSGTGSDGTIGLKAVKEANGLAIAQASGSAQYGGMPRSAEATGLVDLVLPAEKIPAKLLEFARRWRRLADGPAGRSLQKHALDHLASICTLLRARTGHDFSQYKQSTLLRRIQRRMQVLQLDDVQKFVERLRRDPAEIDRLFQDLLIGVTHFFRDRQAFQVLERKVIPKLFENRTDDQIRIWVPGCSTGEEAYSLAILLREHMQKGEATPRIQIFATDIDDKALEFARTGVYSKFIARDVGARRLKRYFAARPDGFQITKDIREMVVFSSHDLIKDPPFSRLDLVSCRNVLIYMTAELQTRLLPLFHFALRPGRFLFLGPAENVSQQPKFFVPVDAKHRIFRTATTVAPHVAALAAQSLRGHTHIARPQGTTGRPPGPRALLAGVERALLGALRPGYVVVNDRSDLVYASADTGKYLEIPPGAPNINVLSMARKGLRLELRAALAKALETRRKVVCNDVALALDGRAQPIRLIVQPFATEDDAETLLLVIFEDMGQSRPHDEVRADSQRPAGEGKLVEQLEAELRATQERLQTTIEELETSNEELKSSNEEFQSMNEELQSANEELETSREELQSVNEELETVNNELGAKVESLDRANSDLKNLLESTQIATIFLDRHHCIRSFTPTVRDLFHLIESDVGRPITDIATRLEHPALMEEVDRVIRTLTPIEAEVAPAGGRVTYIMRILPYQTVGNVIDGVVITFVDITRPKAAEQALRASESSLRLALTTAQAGMWALDPETSERNWSAETYSLFGLNPADGPPTPAELAERCVHPEDRERFEQSFRAAGQPGAEGLRIEFRIDHPQRGPRWIMALGGIERRPGARSARLSGLYLDVTERRLAEERQKLLLAELNHRVKNMLATVLSIANQTLREAPSLQEFQSAFTGRIRALSETQALLTKSNWTGVRLGDIVAVESAPYRRAGERSIELQGSDVVLAPRAALALALVIHELLTNAAKYGALSVPSGRIAVATDGRGGNRRFTLEWQESGGPKVEPPRRQGFGRRVIERSIAHELDGSAVLDFRPAGLHCRIQMPVSAALVQEDKRGRR